MKIEKPPIKTLKNVYEILLFLNKNNTNYVSPEGRAYIDGLYSTGKFPQVYTEKEYMDLYKKYKDLVKQTKKKKYILF